MTQGSAARADRRQRPGRPLLIALAVVLLTAAASWWPESDGGDVDGSLLVLLPVSDARRQEALTGLANHLGRVGNLGLRLEVTADRREFRAALAGALVVLCPDGEALALPSESWQPLALGRRRVPWNLRPASVLLSRREAGASLTPWRSAPGRTAIGDSLSLVCRAPLCADGYAGRLPAGVAWGADPYDHGEVLAAARHGRFDHVVARQWDVEAALADGRLDPRRWRVQSLSDPVPDVVILAARRLPLATRLDLQQALVVLGRQPRRDDQRAGRLLAQLGQFGLDGFNLLPGPDFDRLRQRLGPCWPHPTD